MMKAKSMTGYGAAERDAEVGKVRVEIRALNHRFLDVSLNLPASLYGKEADLRALIQEQVRRARLDVWLVWKPKTEEQVEVRVNRGLIGRLHHELEEVRADLGIHGGDVDLDVLTRFPEAVTIERPAAAITPQAYEVIASCLGAALAALDRTRQSEGQVLVKDIRARFQRIAELTDAAAQTAEAEPRRIAERLKERLQTLAQDISLDPARLHQEVAFLAERADVTEEIVRLKAHLGRAFQLLDEGEDLGKSLDFLLQEVGREVNTLGSKLRAPEPTGLVLAMKSEVEKIREQARNLE